MDFTKTFEIDISQSSGNCGFDSEVSSCEHLCTCVMYALFPTLLQDGFPVSLQIVYKTFTELGFLETFHIPVSHLLKYFHSLELGYHNKPCKSICKRIP